MNLTRKQAMEKYLGVISDAIEAGLHPRCHFEDITRADYYGFVVPFATELMKLSKDSGVPIKIRACDTAWVMEFPIQVFHFLKRAGNHLWLKALCRCAK